MILVQECGTALTAEGPRIHLFSARELRGDDEIIHTACDRELPGEAVGIYEATRGIRPNCDACNGDMRETTRMDTKKTEGDDMDQMTQETDTDTQDASPHVDPDVAAADERLARRLREEDEKKKAAAEVKAPAETKTDDGQKLVPKPRSRSQARRIAIQTNGGAHAESGANGHTNGVHAKAATAESNDKIDFVVRTRGQELAAQRQKLDTEARARFDALIIEAAELADLFGFNMMDAVAATESRIMKRGLETARQHMPKPSERRAATRAAKKYAPKSAAKAEKPAKAVKAKSERLARRSEEEIAKTLDDVVTVIKKAGKEGARAEAIRAALKIDRRELPRVLKHGLETRAIIVKGAKRASTYFARP